MTRAANVNLRVTQATKIMWQCAAGAENRTLSSWIAKTLNDAALEIFQRDEIEWDTLRTTDDGNYVELLKNNQLILRLPRHEAFSVIPKILR